MSSAKKALRNYIRANSTMRDAFKKIDSNFDVAAANNLNFSMLQNSYPAITITGSGNDFEYGGHGRIEGFRDTEVKIQFMHLADEARLSNASEEMRDEESDRLDAFEEIIELFLVEFVQFFSTPRTLTYSGKKTSFHSIEITGDVDATDEIDPEIKTNHSLYRRGITLKVKYNPNTGA